MQLFIFSPSPSPALLSLLPADPGGSRGSRPREAMPAWGEAPKAPGLLLISLYALPSTPAANAGRKTVLRTEKTLWRNLCRFFLGWFVQWFLNAARGKGWAGTGDGGQADVLGGILWGEAAGCHRWRVLASSPGSGQTGRAVLSRCRQRDLQDMGDFLSGAGTPLTESSQSGAWWCECWLGLTWRCSRG